MNPILSNQSICWSSLTFIINLHLIPRLIQPIFRCDPPRRAATLLWGQAFDNDLETYFWAVSPEVRRRSSPALGKAMGKPRETVRKAWETLGKP